MTLKLSKGQAIGLDKPGGGTLTVIRIGLGWRTAWRRSMLSRRQKINLDASAVLFAGSQPIDVVFFLHRVSDDGSVRHIDDYPVGNTDRGGEGKTLLIDLARIPTHIDQIVFTVNSCSDQTIPAAQTEFCCLVDETNGQELARYTVSGGGRHTARVMAKLQRFRTGWQMTAIGAPANGCNFTDLMPTILPHLYPRGVSKPR
ncbi:tellurium resistance protein TerZ [Streptomyces umbrinus]|uniref:Tellurium resistance protein TerZ n=1 Tax=Streptomyces umbrinus TaxID=67370 RepID=A0ABU0SMD8_9ACTN|nr:TerD family protein [Streptomyces umbrinus]MDQ1024723.1 tellurium resistance protein TerZ [Streptomyces umbrinus]